MPSERRREGQTHRYFQPWKDLQASNDRLRIDLNEGQDSNDQQPRSSRDRALTAFAQLATLRLDVKRCMVSLIDANVQYILAEATQTVSLVDTKRHEANDEVWMGSAAIDRHLAVCGLTFDSTYTVTNEDGSFSTHNALVVEDMREDPRFKDREYVKNGSVLFYAGVPIKTRSGIKIGVYGVSKNMPRKPLDCVELAFMRDVADAVMEHLELSKSKNDSVKGERMVRGLTSFIEGYASLEEAAEIDTPSIMPRLPGRTHSFNGDGAPKVKRPEPGSNRKTELSHLFSRAAKIIREATLADGVVFLDATSQIISPGSSENVESDVSNNVEHVHDNDNSGGEREGRVKFQLTRPIKTRSLGADSSIEHDVKRASASDSDTSPARSNQCDVLGIDVLENDMRLSSNIAQFPLARRDLKRCIQRYPAGKVFSMTDDHSTSSGDETMSDNNTTERKLADSVSLKTRRKKQTLRRTIADDILRQLPGVKSVLFIPLWDANSDRWLSGLFLWTNQTGRLIDAEDELPYLKAFANSITSEYARINGMFSERAKTTFIASISHELRSPLHGILGSIEFLHETSIDPYQSGLIGQVETCGKTLLDTINHVLDYAKINDFGTTKDAVANVPGRASGSTSGKDMSLNLVADFDLSVLVEEVTEAIFAGRIFNRQRRSERVKNTGIRKVFSPQKSSEPLLPQNEVSNSDTEVVPNNVTVVLNISKEENWNVRAQPGALRRIIMNLLGNALKYTNQGFVEVSLRSKKEAKQYSKLSVELRFTDSGKGMSDEYQRDRLYRPFSQEDPFTEGTGLGLSIVRQIVELLKGKIRIKSQQGLGTDVTVSFTLPRAKSDLEDVMQLSPQFLDATRGIKVALIDPHTTGKTSEAARRIQTTLRESCEEWFNVETVTTPRFEDGQAAVAIFLEPPSMEYIVENFNGGNMPQDLTCIIILCANAYDSVALRKQLNLTVKTPRRIQVIAQPCGPRKLGKVFELLLLDKSPPQAEISRDTGSLPMSIQPSPSTTPLPMPILPPRAHSETTSVEPTTPPAALEAREILISTLLAQPVKAQPASDKQSTPVSDTRTNDVLKPATLPINRVPRILVVDDNKINLQLLITFMKKAKFEYAAATDGLEALNTYKATGAELIHSQNDTTSSQPLRPAFDYVLMDINMPVLDGLSSTREIRKYEKENVKTLKPAKILALTGLASQQAQEDAFASGIDHFLPKPVNFKELKVLLEKIDEETEKKKEELEN